MTQDDVSRESLDELRQEIDRIDDALHDLLIARTEVVERVGGVKAASGGVSLRPGRQAEILRRLVARHHGRFPRPVLIHLWHEMMGALVALQGPFSLAVYMPERGAGYLELARDQYGSYSTCAAFRSVGQVVRAVADGAASVGILPMPDREDVEPWWTSLMPDNPDIPRVIARLPFVGPGVGRGDGIEALAIARMPAEATGYDRSFLAVETSVDVSRGRLRTALGAAGLEPTHFPTTHHSEEFWLHLVEISGYVAPDDRRLRRLVEGQQPAQRAVVLGCYPVPLRPEDLAE